MGLDVLVVLPILLLSVVLHVSQGQILLHCCTKLFTPKPDEGAQRCFEAASRAHGEDGPPLGAEVASITSSQAAQAKVKWL